MDRRGPELACARDRLMYLAISGNIGSGKSSLTRMLSERYGLRPVYEPYAENPYLEDFYQDMRRYSFHSQVYFLSKRLEQHLDAGQRREVRHSGPHRVRGRRDVRPQPLRGRPDAGPRLGDVSGTVPGHLACSAGAGFADSYRRHAADPAKPHRRAWARVRAEHSRGVSGRPQHALCPLDRRL